MGASLRKTDDDNCDFPVHLSGSMYDGQYQARLLQKEGIACEYDVMYITKVEIQNENQIEYVVQAPGHIRIFDRKLLQTLPQGSPFENNQPYVNGFKMKQDVYSIIQEQNIRTMDKSTIAMDQASLFFQFSDAYPSADPDILQKLDIFKQNLTDRQKQIAHGNIEQCILYLVDLFGRCTKRNYYNITKDLFHVELPDSYFDISFSKRMSQLIDLYKILYLSLTGEPIPRNLREKFHLLLQFYKKYRHMINEDIHQEALEKNQNYTEKEDCDIVISIKLNFWPQIIRSRINYLKHHKHHIYQRIKHSHVFAIPKWSKLTAEIEAPYEFRLSFSIMEAILAKSRSANQKLLNRIARTIYYKHLKMETSDIDKPKIPSYFVKTCVLWMCEIFDIEQDDQQQLPIKFIAYARQKLETGICQHYFIEYVNILAPYNLDTRKEACDILEKIDIENLFSEVSKDKVLNHEKLSENIVRFSSEMVEEFHELQLKHFDEQCHIYLPEKYDLSLRQIFYNLSLIEENNTKWWDNWTNVFLSADHNEKAIANLTNLNAFDIVSCFFNFTYAIQRRWPVIKYLLFEDIHMEQFLMDKRQKLVSISLLFFEQLIHDIYLERYRTATLSDILQQNQYKHIISNSLAMSSIPVGENEKITIRTDLLLDEFWNSKQANFINDILTVSGVGYSIVKYVFAIDERFGQ
ncbi:unnamed protein product, partial [Didymodactylos carnosus]